MDKNDKNKFLSLMTGLGEIFGKEITQQLAKIYWNAFREYDIENIELAVNLHIKDKVNGKYFPKPADLYAKMDGGGDISIEDMAMVGWASVVACMESVGAYGNLNIDDKLAILVVKNMGGWKYLCHVNRDNLGFKRAEFISLYKSLSNTPMEYLPQSLIGITHYQESKAPAMKSINNLIGNYKDE